MLSIISKYYLRISHSALIGILQPKEHNRLLLQRFKHCQILPLSAGLAYSNLRCYGCKKLTEEAASDSTSTSNGLYGWSADATTDPTSASNDLDGWSSDGVVQNSMDLLQLEYKQHIEMLQMKMAEPIETGSVVESSLYAQEMVTFIKGKIENTLEEPIREGCIFWLADLTTADPTYVLPLITCASRYFIMKIFTDKNKSSAQNTNTMKFVSRVMPITILSFMINPLAAIPTYLACRSIIRLGKKAVLNIPAVNLKINKHVLNEQNKTWSTKNKGFTSNAKKSCVNVEITRKLEELKRLDGIRCIKVGDDLLVTTLKCDRTKSYSIAGLQFGNKIVLNECPSSNHGSRRTHFSRVIFEKLFGMFFMVYKILKKYLTAIEEKHKKTN